MLRRYAPFLAVVVVAIVVIILVGRSGGGSSKKHSSAPVQTGPSTAPVVFSPANKSKVHWGPNCDTTRGTVAVPLTYAPPCVAPFTGNNGGATAPGVTKTTITIALYQGQPDVVQENFFKRSGSDTSLAAERETTEQYIKFFEAHYETYGRHVKLVPIKATGAADDEAAAKADAIKVATQIHAFASFGGPAETSAYADQLAAEGVMCLGPCMLASTNQFAQQRADRIWLTFPSVDQLTAHWEEFLLNELNNRDAKFSGDPTFHDKKRVFGVMRFDENFAGIDQAGAKFVKELKRKGVNIAADVPYPLDLSRSEEIARNAIAKFKHAKVTTVIFAGDPLMPSSLTKEATLQKFFPEWVLLGAAYTDTTLFGRTYDQRQWTHAFGVSSLPVHVPESADPLAQVLVWQSGEPPAAKTFRDVVQAPLIFFTGLHLAGPRLTDETFREGLFRYPSRATNPTEFHLSWGNHGIWPYTDYFGGDDTTLIWWNPNAYGTDEVENPGKGMWEYSNGGKRYLPGQWPTGEPNVFDPATSVTQFTTLPPGQRPPSYPSPASH
ncbi:MAG TPA: hypothetical protein VIC35_02565 [Acidimicrobiia bacterium]